MWGKDGLPMAWGSLLSNMHACVSTTGKRGIEQLGPLDDKIQPRRLVNEFNITFILQNLSSIFTLVVNAAQWKMEKYAHGWSRGAKLRR